jgi:2-keto-4-pentenoate hydratase/2-oxohepta-3-ene-1,7-dioic acid hydratase in catechol pathway
MRIVRIDHDGGPVMGVEDDDGAVRRIRASGSTELIKAAVAAGGLDALLTDERLEGPHLAPVGDPRKIVAIGLNYVDHAAEATMKLPEEPLVFAKFPSSIIGPDAPIRWSRGLTDGVDYEAELAVVIGRPARDVSVEDALDHVFGYTCLNDVSARDLQFADGQWVRGKSLDTFCPIGPWIVTADEIPDPQALSISCRIGDEVLQEATTADMIFGVAELISRLSRSFTLETGDVIATGTPPGVGWFRDPRRVLADGDTVTVEIGRIGALSNPVVVDA